VQDYLELWNWDGTLERVHHTLYVAVREQAGREASPTAAIIDSQGAKGAQKGGLGSILRATTRQEEVDAMGLLLSAVVHPADVQDRDGAFQLLRRARRLLSFIERIADGGYAGNKMRSSSAHAWRLRIVKRFDAAGLEVLPKRWDRRTNFLRGSAAIAAWLVTLNATPQTVVAFVRFAAQAARCKHLGMNLNFPDGPLDTHSNM
jgi:transposase